MHSPFHTSCFTDPRLAKGEKANERTNRVELDGNPRDRTLATNEAAFPAVT